MKRILIASTTVIAIFLFALASLTAEVTKEIEADLSVPAGSRLVIENLIGSMKVLPGSGDTVRVVATVHAENQALADSVRLDQTEKGGKVKLRVYYPLDEYKTIRLPEGTSVSTGGGFLDRWIGNRTKYGEYSIKLSDRKGVLLYADVQVQVPDRDLTARFSNLVGSLHGEGVRGELTFASDSGDVTLKSMRGEVIADTGSGDIKAKEIEGSFTCDTGSGNCDLESVRGDQVDCDTGSGDITLRAVKVSGAIQADTGSGDVHGHDLEGSTVCDTGSGDCTIDGLLGDSLRCDTGSGTVRLRSVTVDRIVVDTGSGDVLATGINAREVLADTGSGDVHLGTAGDRLSLVRADTGSGQVKVSLQANASFELRANTGSGDLISRFDDAEALIKDKELIGYRRGAAKIKLVVDTGSGDVIVEPTRKAGSETRKTN